VYDKDRRFVYAGRVGTGFSDRQIEDLSARLDKLGLSKRPFAEPVPESDTAHWVRPELVVDVTFTERTASGVLRHPSFRGLREDRDADSIGADPSDKPVSNERRAGPTKLPRSDTAKRKRRAVKLEGVRLTHPDRVVYPETGLTKLELARYFVAIADWILPHIAERPLSLLRCPDGRNGECFFQKHPRTAFPDSLPTLAIADKNDPENTQDYVYVSDAADLVALVQAGVLEIHPWGARIDNVERPDQLVFDLDPHPDVEWAETCRIARDLRAYLAELELTAFLRTTGGKGLHLVVPIERHTNWDDAKAFARAVCRTFAAREPKRLTTNMAKHIRRGKIFLDYIRNGRGATAIASYSTRAHDTPTIAVPIRWEELAGLDSPDHYDIARALQRLQQLESDPWANVDSARKRITKAIRKAVGRS
jgi:bifunctional non-homologous end joining protein LigD